MRLPAAFLLRNPMKFRSSLCLRRTAAALAALSIAGSAFAFADDDARRAILDLRETVKAIQADLSVSKNAQMQLMTEINRLKEQNRHLTGQVEELYNALEMEKRSTRDLFGSLDSRVEAFEPQTVVINGESVTVDPKEKQAFDGAVLHLQDRQYKQAENGFKRFAAEWPKSPYRPDALFWWGTAAFALEHYKTVISTQNQLLREYPKNPRAADAMLLVGSAQAASGNLKAARATFQKVQKTYPDSEAAVTAKARLASLGK